MLKKGPKCGSTITILIRILPINLLIQVNNSLRIIIESTIIIGFIITVTNNCCKTSLSNLIIYIRVWIWVDSRSITVVCSQDLVPVQIKYTITVPIRSPPLIWQQYMSKVGKKSTSLMKCNRMQETEVTKIYSLQNSKAYSAQALISKIILIQLSVKIS